MDLMENRGFFEKMDVMGYSLNRARVKMVVTVSVGGYGLNRSARDICE